MASWLDNMQQLKGGPPPMSAGGLAALTGALGGPAFAPPPPVGLDAVTAPAANQNPMNPMQRIYGKPKVQDIIDIIAANPDASASAKQQLLAMATAPYEQQQAMMAQKRTELGAAAATASATMPLGQAQAALNTQFPQFVDKPAMASALSGGYGATTDPGALGMLNPSYGPASSASTFDNTDKPVVAQQLDLIPNLANPALPPTDAVNLAVMEQYKNAARAFALANGLDASGQQQAVDFAAQYWAAKVGAPASVLTPGATATSSSNPLGDFAKTYAGLVASPAYTAYKGIKSIFG